MKNLTRIAMLVFFIYAVFFALTTLQSLFDRGDFKRASALFFNSPFPGTEKTVVDLMAASLAKAPAAVSCQMGLESREHGTVRLSCEGGFEWIVDVVASRIEPASVLAKELLGKWVHPKQGVLP